MSRRPKGKNNGTHSDLKLHIMKNSREKWAGSPNNEEVDDRRVGTPKPKKELG